MATEITKIVCGIEDKIPKQTFPQYDGGHILRFEFTDTQDNSSEPLDLTDNLIMLVISKPDNTVATCSGSVIDGQGGQCEVQLSEQALAATGIAKAQLMMTGADTIRTAVFNIEITSSLDGEGIESSDDFSALQELMQLVSEKMANIDSAAETVEALQQIHVANVTTLSPTQQATADFDVETGALSFAIPQGETGAAATVYQAGNEAEAVAYSAQHPSVICYWLG